METARIREFRQRMRRYRRMITEALEQDCADLPVSVPQCDVMLEMERLGDTTIADLSQVLRLDKSTLSRTVDSLVELGFVARTPNSSDRRYNVLSLTPEGKAVCEQINTCSDEGVRAIFGTIPEADRLAALEGFIRVVDALDACESCGSDENDGDSTERDDGEGERG